METAQTPDLSLTDGPRPHSEQQVGLALVTLGVKVGGGRGRLGTLPNP
jgi:hypothetical protein